MGNRGKEKLKGKRRRGKRKRKEKKKERDWLGLSWWGRKSSGKEGRRGEALALSLFPNK